MNFAAAIALHARQRPDHPALLVGCRSVSYRELDRLVVGAAARLGSQGIGRGDVVALALRETVAHVASVLAVVRLGGVLLQMDWRWAPAEQARVARSLGARLVLLEPGHPVPPAVPAIAAEEVWPERSFAEDPRWPELPDEAPARMALSSGTTGQPKAVLISHGRWRVRSIGHMLAFGYRASDRYLSVMPLSFSFGLTAVFSFLRLGATVILDSPFATAAEIVALTRSSKATALCLVPSMLRSLLDLPPEGVEPLQQLRLLTSIGAPLQGNERLLVQDRLCSRFIEVYGSTQGGFITVIDPDEQRRFPSSVGRPMMDVQLQIVDEAGVPQPPGTVGQLRVSGPEVADGYYGAPPDSGESFQDGWYLSGDYALLDKDGFVHLRGRRSDVVIRSGLNVYTMEVEEVLGSHPAVAEVAVTGALAANGEEELVAFVRSRAPVEPRALAAHGRVQLAAYKIPTRIEILAALPRNSAGKVLKRQLLAEFGLTPLPG